MRDWICASHGSIVRPKRRVPEGVKRKEPPPSVSNVVRWDIVEVVGRQVELDEDAGQRHISIQPLVGCANVNLHAKDPGRLPPAKAQSDADWPTRV